MRKAVREAYWIRAAAGGVASLAIALILAEEGLLAFDGLLAFETRSVAYATAALLPLALGLLWPRRFRRLRIRMLGRGETLHLAQYRISPREREFIFEMLDGSTMKEIAADHGISYSTVRNDFSCAYAKLGISCMAELAVLGERYKIE